MIEAKKKKEVKLTPMENSPNLCICGLAVKHTPEEFDYAVEGVVWTWLHPGEGNYEDMKREHNFALWERKFWKWVAVHKARTRNSEEINEAKRNYKAWQERQKIRWLIELKNQNSRIAHYQSPNHFMNGEKVCRACGAHHWQCNCMPCLEGLVEPTTP
jgi:hypothetical protein